MKKAKCIKGFSVEKCDDNGFTIDNASADNSVEWLEITKKRFEECFEIFTKPKSYETIENFIKENQYTYKVKDILESYEKLYLKNWYVSYTMKHCIENLETEIKDLLELN